MGAESSAADETSSAGSAGTEKAAEKSAPTPPPDEGKGLDFGKLKREELESMLSQTRTDLAQARRLVTNREDEAKRVYVKYETALKEIGDEQSLDEFRNWKKDKQKAEEDRLRKEGELEKIIAARDKKLAESEGTIHSLRLDLFRSRIDRELGDAASRLDAVSLQQVSRLFGEPGDWIINEKGDLVHKTRTHPDSGVAFSPLALLEHEKSGANANLFRAALQSGSGSAAGGSGGGANGGAKVTIRMVQGRVVPEDQRKYEAARDLIRKGEMNPDNIVFEYARR